MCALEANKTEIKVSFKNLTIRLQSKDTILAVNRTAKLAVETVLRIRTSIGVLLVVSFCSLPSPSTNVEPSHTNYRFPAL